MNLIRLSLQNVTGKRQPVVFDNDTRARIYRAARPSPTHNERVWNFTETFARPSPACLRQDDADWCAFVAQTTGANQ